MEQILIQYAPDGKSTAEKLLQILKQNNFGVTTGASALSDGDIPELVIAVFSPKADTNSAFMSALDYCQEKDINVVPFVTCKMDTSATQQYFLNDHVWIDNFETVFSSASADLLDLLTKNYGDLADRKRLKKEKESKKQRRSVSAAKSSAKSAPKGDGSKETLYKNICYMLGAVVVILLAITMFRPNASDPGASNKSLNTVDLNSNIRTSENPLIGTWRMESYADNQFRANLQDSIDHQAAVDQLISVASLVFTADRKFVRTGFTPNPERGYWEYDPSSHYLKMQPEGDTKFDQVQLQELNDQKMIIVVSEKVDNLDIITKITFRKVSN